MNLNDEARALIDAAVPWGVLDNDEPTLYEVPAENIHRLAAAIEDYQRREDMAVAAHERALEYGGVR